jgi:antitoxin (DNA-binding transcriptional repressor) of toxin-antitoxin stability system
MVNVDVLDFRQNLPAWLARVRGGEEVAILDSGAVIARLVPPEDARAQARRALEALRPHARVGDVESPLENWPIG